MTQRRPHLNIAHSGCPYNEVCQNAGGVFELLRPHLLATRDRRRRVSVDSKSTPVNEPVFLSGNEQENRRQWLILRSRSYVYRMVPPFGGVLSSKYEYSYNSFATRVFFHSFLRTSLLLFDDRNDTFTAYVRTGAQAYE